jgi:hypothetical protein
MMRAPRRKARSLWRPAFDKTSAHALPLCMCVCVCVCVDSYGPSSRWSPTKLLHKQPVFKACIRQNLASALPVCLSTSGRLPTVVEQCATPGNTKAKHRENERKKTA